MTVVFYVDPALAKAGAARPNTITLSYSFHRQQQVLRAPLEDARAGRG